MRQLLCHMSGLVDHTPDCLCGPCLEHYFDRGWQCPVWLSLQCMKERLNEDDLCIPLDKEFNCLEALHASLYVQANAVEPNPAAVRPATMLLGPDDEDAHMIIQQGISGDTIM